MSSKIRNDIYRTRGLTHGAIRRPGNSNAALVMRIEREEGRHERLERSNGERGTSST